MRYTISLKNMGFTSHKTDLNRSAGLILLAFLCLGQGANANAPDVRPDKFSETSSIDSRQSYIEINAQIKKVDTSIDDVKKQLNLLSEHIKELKRTKGSTAFLKKYKLQNRLQDAQILSDRLTELNSTRARLFEKKNEIELVFVDWLDQQIESYRRHTFDKHESLENRQKSANELSKLLIERFSLLAKVSPNTKEWPSGIPPLADSDQDLKEQLLAMEDLEKQLIQDSKTIKAEINSTRKQKFLQRELALLFEEEAFFGEQGFITVGKPSLSKSQAGIQTDSTLTKNKTESTEVSTNNSDTAQTETTIEDSTVQTENPGTVQEPQQASTTTMAYSESFAENAKEVGASIHAKSVMGVEKMDNKTKALPEPTQPTPTDERAMLRGEQRSDKRNNRPIQEMSSLDQTIVWLQIQLNQARSMLEEVKKAKTEIRQVLHRVK
ncbi:MAG: hypothetical protein KDD48_06150 [Bdellovibrionales bacterium]|nr:hypothetical protein [Bdellovibrionales bacterium]